MNLVVGVWWQPTFVSGRFAGCTALYGLGTRKHSRKIEMAGVHDSPKSVAGPGGFAPGDLPLPLSLEEAHKEIMELRFEVESLRAQVLASPKRKRATSELADGTKLDDIAIDEMVAMRRIFDVIDTNNNGCVTATDIGKLHASLGEPLEGKKLCNLYCLRTNTCRC